VNILLLSHYFPPEIGPGQSRAYEYAVRLAGRGHQVTVLTCFPNYPYGKVPKEYRWRLLSVEHMAGVKVVRTFVLPLPNAGFVRRLANQLSFAVSALLALAVLGPTDVIDVISPPLFLGFPAYLISRIKRAKFVFEVLDLWPESAVDLGQLKRPWFIRAATRMAAFLYHHADAITASAPQQETAVERYGVPRHKIHFLPNSVDVEFFSRGDPGYLATAVPELKEKRVILYLGNLGWAQGLEVLLHAAGRMRDMQETAFVLMGEGGAKSRLLALRAELRLQNVVFLKAVPRETVPHVLQSASVCVSTLHPGDVFRGVLPTKILEYMAASRPIVAAVGGDAAEAIQRAGAGWACEPGDDGALAAGLRRVLSSRREAESMGGSGCRFVREHYSRDAMVARLDGVLRHLLPDRQAAVYSHPQPAART
jgi:glycosyltransferase involved in cell wall biosynthesis